MEGQRDSPPPLSVESTKMTMAPLCTIPAPTLERRRASVCNRLFGLAVDVDWR